MKTGTASSQPEQTAPHQECDCEALLQLVAPELYRQNAFRVLGLPITATTRAIATHVQRLQVLAGVGRVDPSLNGPLPLKPPPDAEAIRAAEQKLHDPQARILQELFWFWPLGGVDGAEEPGFRALKAGDVAGAERIWEAATPEPRTRASAKHNLAVLTHLMALGLELRRGNEPANQPPSESLLKLWPRALRLWDEVVQVDATWSTLSARVLAIDDNRLSLDFVQGIRRSLPSALLRINVELALTYAERGQWSMADAHVEWVLGSRLKMVRAPEFARMFISGTKSRFRRLIEDVEKVRSGEPSSGARTAGELLDAIEPYSTSFELLEGESGNTSWHEIQDEVADTATSCVFAFQNNQGDESVSLGLLNRALQITHREALRQRIEQGIATINGNMAGKLLEPYFAFIKAIRGSKSTAKVRLATFQRELEPGIAQARQILDSHRQPKGEFLSIIGNLLRDISVDAWNQGKDAPTALRALELAEAYAPDAELKARLKQDRAALEPLIAAQQQEAFKKKLSWGVIGAIVVLVMLWAIFQTPDPAKQAPDANQVTGAASSEAPGGSASMQGSAGNDGLATDESSITESGQTFRVPHNLLPELNEDRAAAQRAQAAARALDRQLDAAKDAADAKQAALHQLRERLDALEQTLRSEKITVQDAGEYAVQQFNADVDRYNTKLRNYRSDLRAANALVDRYNELLTRAQARQQSANTLVDTYNAKLRRYGHPL